MTTIKLSTPPDIFAAIPVILGFQPTESVVMLTFGAQNTFHARVDLPTDAHEIDQMVGALLTPCLQHGVQSVLFALVSTTPQPAVTDALRDHFTPHMTVHDILRGDGTFVFRDETLLDAYNVAESVITATAAVENGTAPFASREALAQSLSVRDDALTNDEIAAFREAPTTELGQRCYDITLAAQFLIIHDLVDFAAALLEPNLRDCALAALSRANAPAQVKFWIDVATRIEPGPARDEALALTAFAAWLSGHGALAWCATELVSNPRHTLTQLISTMLDRAMPPSEWQNDGLLDTALGRIR